MATIPSDEYSSLREEKTWNILQVISTSVEFLKDKGINEARLNAELLLAHALGCKRVDLYRDFDKPLREAERNRYKALLRRRLAREPLQYIIGETEFMGLCFYVDRRVLVPRPDTEVLVEKAIELCKSYGDSGERIKVLDIGTGCGNIALSIARFVENSIVTAIDISREALEVAKKNAEAFNVSERVVLKPIDLFEDSIFQDGDTFDLILSNPPYISTREFQCLYPEIRDYEPRLATCDESDGLKFFPRISEVGKRLLRRGGHLLIEVGFGQPEEVEDILARDGYSEIKVFEDLSGIERVVRGKFST